MVGASIDQPVRVVGLVGGTGKLGMALATRFANAGLSVVLGSRVPARAIDAATAVRDGLPRTAGAITGADNATACAVDGVVIVALPYEGLEGTLAALTDSVGDRVVVSAVVPVRFARGEGFTPIDVPAGSACEQIAAQLPSARVVGALQTLSYVTLRDVARPIGSDVIITGDDVRTVDGGGIRNSRFVEQLTVLLLAINARYHRHAGVRVTDIPDELAADWSGEAR